MPNTDSLKKNADGLEYVSLRHPSGSLAEVYCFGGVPTRFQDAGGTEWLTIRKDSKLDGSKPISGGMAHCFPQFGPGVLQQHGFARNVDWEVAKLGESSVTLKLKPSAYSKGMWDKPFAATFTVALTDYDLETKLVVDNTGDVPFDFQAALHR